MTWFIHPKGNYVAVASVIALATAAGLFVQSVAAAFLPVLLIAGTIAAVHSTARFILFLFLAALTFGGAESVDLLGAAFVLAFLCYWMVSLVRSSVIQSERQGYHVAFCTFRNASLVFGGYVLTTFLVSSSAGKDPLSWLRDALPLLLVAAAPLLAIDLASGLSEERYWLLLRVVGLFSSLSVAIEWAARRGFSMLPAERLLYGSVWPVFAMCSFGLYLYIVRRRNASVLLAPVIGLSLLFVSGSRGILLLSFGLFVGVTLTSRYGDRGTNPYRFRRVTKLLVIVPMSIGVVFTAISRSGVVGSNDLFARFASLTNVMDYGSSDLSFVGREVQTRAAFAVFRDSPVFGTGPAETIDTSLNYLGYRFESSSMDSPAAFLAENGVIGLIALLTFLLLLVKATRLLPPESMMTDVWKVPLIFLSATVFFLPLTDLASDRGFSLGLLLVLSPLFIAPREDDRRSLSDDSLSIHRLDKCS